MDALQSVHCLLECVVRLLESVQKYSVLSVNIMYVLRPNLCLTTVLLAAGATAGMEGSQQPSLQGGLPLQSPLLHLCGMCQHHHSWGPTPRGGGHPTHGYHH